MACSAVVWLTDMFLIVFEQQWSSSNQINKLKSCAGFIDVSVSKHN